MASVEIPIVRVREGQRQPALDRAAAEEPLEIRIHDRSFAIIMRTPGHDCELAAGFLLAERVIATPDDLGAIELCRDIENVVNVTLANAAHDRLDRIAADRRELVANSSCGVCGRTTIESLRANLTTVPPGFQVPGAWISSLPERLRAAQPVFAATGGLHAAALFRDAGAPAASAEDVGRHNAVDKIIGRMIMRDALPLSDVVLFVSGRTSFEIVQKAWCAQVPILASVSAPSSLAVALARDAGITLVGFVRDGNFNIYTHPERIA